MPVTALSKYGRDLTALARAGKLDPLIGRDDELRRWGWGRGQRRRRRGAAAQRHAIP